MLVNQEEKWEKLKVLDFLKPSAVTIELTATTKKGVLEELVDDSAVGCGGLRDLVS